MTTKKQTDNSSTEDLAGKNQQEILEIIATQSGDLVSKAMEIANSKKFLNEAILAAASNKKQDVRNWAAYYLIGLEKNKETKEVLEKLKLNNDSKVKDVVWKKWRMCRFDRKLKAKVKA